MNLISHGTATGWKTNMVATFGELDQLPLKHHAYDLKGYNTCRDSHS